MQPGDVISTEADSSLLEKHINYKPNTTLKKGIKKFVEWYQHYHSNINSIVSHK